MKILAAIVLLGLVYALYEAVRIRPLLHSSRELVANAVPFAHEGGVAGMLVLGDSTAVGVGAARPDETLAGRIAALHPEWRVENYAVSGARIHDMRGQLSRTRTEHFSLALVQVGANDVIRFRAASRAVQEMEEVITALQGRSEKVVFLMAGNVGGTIFFPRILNPLYRYRTQQYHAAFEALAERTGSTYVNLYTDPQDDPFLKDVKRYFSADGLHPSSEGYRLWFERVREVL